MEDGTRLTEADLIRHLDRDLVSYSFDRCYEYAELYRLKVTTEVSKYEIAIQWIRRLLWSSKNPTTKLQNRIAVMKQSIPKSLRDASSTMSDVQWGELYTDHSTKRAFGARRLIEWIPAVERQLKKDDQGIAKQLESLRAICTHLCDLYLFHS
jgi:hypothetical protein